MNESKLPLFRRPRVEFSFQPISGRRQETYGPVQERVLALRVAVDIGRHLADPDEVSSTSPREGAGRKEDERL